MTALFQMSNPIQPYLWGDTDTLARLQGREPTGSPEAELWIGAHASAPSTIHVDGRTVSLSDATQSEPWLVGGCTEFPFLMKILAIAKPLSLQVHPSAEQARDGYDREQAAGIPIDAPQRTYKDRLGKPEVVLAITPMLLLNGERNQELLTQVHAEFPMPWLREALDEADGSVIKTILTWPEQRRQDALAATHRVLGEQAHSSSQAGLRRDVLEVYDVVGQNYPQDLGLLVALCMHLVRLNPGQALLTRAGQLHAYMSGTAIEIMDASDNVLRAGLTAKHVDISELLAITKDHQDPPALIRPFEIGGGIQVFPLWRDDIALCRVEVVDQVQLDAHGLSVLLTLEGDLTVSTSDQTIPLRQGHSVLYTGQPCVLTLDGKGLVCIGVNVGADQIRNHQLQEGR